MKPTVLFVDDDAGVRDSLTRITRQEQYRVLTAGSAEEAVNLLAVTDVQVLIQLAVLDSLSSKEEKK